MARLLAVAHGPTTRTRDLVFADESGVARPDLVEPLTVRVDRWFCAPEPACQETSGRLGAAADLAPELAGFDAGTWAGLGAAEVGATDPAGLQQWSSDADARPHGGETLAELVVRAGRWLDGASAESGRTVVVATSLVVRALTVAALGAPPSVIFRLDVAPLGQVHLSRSGPSWRLQGLR